MILPVSGNVQGVFRPVVVWAMRAVGKQAGGMNVPIWVWVAFAAVVVVMLAVDLLAHRGAHVIKFKEAAIWSAVWVAVALVFALMLGSTLVMLARASRCGPRRPSAAAVPAASGGSAA